MPSQQLSGTVDNVDVAKDFVNSRIKATLFSFLEDIVKSLGFDSVWRSISSFDAPYTLKARAVAH